jgi:signal transduction histidine kinase
MTETETKPRVAVVDDEISARETIEALLFREGYELELYDSPVSALEALRKSPPDVALLDVMMPEMDGFELCSRLKNDERTRHVPIILVTALGSRADFDAGHEAGADEFINKPVSGHHLRARVRSMLRIKAQYDRLQEALRLREDLAHMVVHDMRSPLTSASIQLELLRRSRKEDSELQGSLEGLSRAHKRLQLMMDDILAMARYESGRIQVERSEVDVAGLVETTIEAHRENARGRRIEILPSIRIDRPVFVDHHLVERALDNLLGNAVKYTDPGTTVSVEGRVVVNFDEASGPTGFPELELTVRDEGPGVSDETKERVFDRYEIAGAKRHGRVQIGLGLAFVRLAAEAHGGRCWVEDNDPKGSAFVMRLPSAYLHET